MASQRLESRGIRAEVINIHTIKPLDGKTILDSIKRTGCVVVAEEHQRLGGLGAMVAQLLASHAPAPMLQVAVEDCFGESGTPAQLMDKYGLNAQAIEAASSEQPAASSQAGRTANEIDPAVVLETVQRVLDENKAEDITSFDLRERTSVSDHMVICSGRSTTHVGALAEFLRQDLKKLGADIVSVTGTGHGDWICVDANAVVIHIFRPEVRAFYQIEKMWQNPAALRPSVATEPAASPAPG